MIGAVNASNRPLTIHPRFVPYMEKHRIYELFHVNFSIFLSAITTSKYIFTPYLFITVYWFALSLNIHLSILT